MNRNSRRLKAAMVEKYGSQTNFAQAMKLDDGYVSRVINGRTNLSDNTQKNWARKLGRKVEDIFNV